MDSDGSIDCSQTNETESYIIENARIFPLSDDSDSFIQNGVVAVEQGNVVCVAESLESCQLDLTQFTRIDLNGANLIPGIF